MLAGTALVGTKYLSKTGIPVKVVEIKGDKVVLFSEATQTNITVSKNYPLRYSGRYAGFLKVRWEVR